MKDFDFQIGELVAVKNHPYFGQPKNEDKYIGTIINCSSDNYPLMLIAECVQSIQKKQEVNECSSEVIDRSYLEKKYLCSWYDSILGKFQEAWFKTDVLIKFPNNLLSPVTPDKSNLLKKVFLKTSLIERYKKILGQNRMNDRFVSSSFIIKEFNDENQYKWTNKELGHCEKMISKTKVKVQWFNVIKGKYSEEWLPIEFLQETPNLTDIKYNVLSQEVQIKGGSPLMNLLSEKEFNYLPQNSEEGKNLENLIFFYLVSEGKIILDERVYAFDRYLSKNKLLVLNYNIHINSNNYDSFKLFYAKVDLLLKRKESEELIAIDLISGNSLVKEDDILPLAQTPENKEELSGISLYNGRAFIMEELLKKKYGIQNVSSKLLIINSKLSNLIKEIDVKECPFSLECVTK